MKILDTYFTQLRFYDSFVLSQPKEGIVLEEKHIKKLRKTCLEHFGEQPFVYLSLRQADYNVNPTVYFNLDKIINLKGIGIVCSQVSCLNNASFEKRFSKVPFEVFLDLEEAKAWAEKLVKK